MTKLTIIKLGETFPDLANRVGDFEDWIARGLGRPAERLDLVDARHGCSLPAPTALSAVVLTGSHRMVTDLEEPGRRVALWLRGIVEAAVPILGICYGHQLLAHAMGGTVGPNPLGPEIGTREIELTAEADTDPLFRNMPSPFLAHCCHEQSVLSPPPGAAVLAANPHDSCHAFRIGTSAWGVQFHPEFTADICGQYLLRYCVLSDSILPGPRQHPEVQDIPAGSLLLELFNRLADPLRPALART